MSCQLEQSVADRCAIAHTFLLFKVDFVEHAAIDTAESLQCLDGINRVLVQLTESPVELAALEGNLGVVIMDVAVLSLRAFGVIFAILAIKFTQAGLKFLFRFHLWTMSSLGSRFAAMIFILASGVSEAFVRNVITDRFFQLHVIKVIQIGGRVIFVKPAVVVIFGARVPTFLRLLFPIMAFSLGIELLRSVVMAVAVALAMAITHNLAKNGLIKVGFLLDLDGLGVRGRQVSKSCKDCELHFSIL